MTKTIFKKSKTETDLKEAQDYLRFKYSAEFKDITPLEGGVTTQAYKFRLNDKTLILKVNEAIDRIDTFRKEKFLTEIEGISFFAPKIFSIEKKFKKLFIISEAVKGEPLESFLKKCTKNSRELLIGQLGEVFTLFKKTRVKNNLFERKENWSSYILTRIKKDHRHHWNDIVTKTFFKPEFYEQIKNRIIAMKRVLPEDANDLVHGDFHMGHIYVKNGKISGIIDWGNAMTGDSLYDVATFMFWSPKISLINSIGESQGSKVLIKERVLFYQLIVLLSVLGHFARMNDLRAFKFTFNKWFKNGKLKI